MTTVFGTALNFNAALRRLGDSLNRDPYKAPPNAPILYIKPRNTWIGNGSPIVCPAETEKLRMGGTLGIVIGSTACRVSEADALRHVGSYVVVNDVSIPHESYYRPAIRQRCRNTFCVIGAPIAKESLPSPDRLEIRIKVNNEVRSVCNTADLVRGAARLVADVSEFITLCPGDTLLVGEPDNAPLAGIGDRVCVEIESVGAIENAIFSEEQGESKETGGAQR